MLCQPSIATAANRIAALKISCPRPATAAARVSANPATTIAPSAPPAIPPPTHPPRPGTPWLAAMTMPTISAASSPSRKTMIAVASIGSAHHQKAPARRVEIIEKLVAPGLQRSDEDAGRAAGRDDLLAMQRRALEF